MVEQKSPGERPEYEGSKPIREAKYDELTPEGRDAAEAAAFEAAMGPEGGEGPGGDDDLPDDLAPHIAEMLQAPVKAPRPEPENEDPMGDEPAAIAPPAPAETADQPDDDAYRLAAAALRRDGWSTEDIAYLPRERVVAIGAEKRVKVQADTDKAFEELTQLRGQQGAARENEVRRGENEAEAPAGVDVEAIADSLGVSEDAVRSLVETVRAPLLQEVSSIRKELGNTTKERQRAELQTARAELQERFPEFLADSAMPRVLTRMDKLQNGGAAHGSTRELMEDAILLEFQGEIAAKSAERTATLRRARANGQTVTSRGAQKQPGKEDGPLTKDELERRVFDELFDPSVKDYGARLQNARKLTN